MTSLTLLLIVLHNRQGDRDDRVKLEDLVFSERFGKKSFNIDVGERSACMEALFHGTPFDASDGGESVQAISARYEDLEELLPDEIDEHALPYFSDWLIENVHLVEITAFSDEDAYTIFETMNDRGLSLSPLDMLKGHLLACIRDPEQRNSAAESWRRTLGSLRELGKDEDSDAVKTWLRAKYAQSVRERKRGAENQDFETIGSEFHRWVRDHAERMKLATGDDYARLVEKDFAFFAKQYRRLRLASETLTPGLEEVYYVAKANFTLQYPLLLAPVCRDDSPEIIDRKIQMVGRFLDIVVARRAVNYLSLTFGAMSYYVFTVMREIRDVSLPELAKILTDRLDGLGCDFDGTTDKRRDGFRSFSLNHWSKRYIKWLLARMTDYIESESGQPGRFAEYMAGGRARHEVEHIWADKPQRHRDEFEHQADFADYRNRFGGLLLLPKPFNASYGALTYSKKLPQYRTQNLLAHSLHPQCYEHNPGFVGFINESGIAFEAHEQFKKRDLDQRSSLYRSLAERIWNPDRISGAESHTDADT